jgi:spore maturation protein CgeB
MFYHSLMSDWNHGNAHFLRGVVSELLARGHHVAVYEPRDAWSAQNLVAEHGEQALQAYRAVYPSLTSRRYDLSTIQLDRVLDGANLVLVHEWSDPQLVARIGELRRRLGGAPGGFRLLFHDTHHRAVTRRADMEAFDLRHYDGVLAYGRVLADVYRREGWAQHVWTWHEAADVRVFKPMPGEPREGDLVWIGNWGDDERTAELHEFLIAPARDLALRTRVHGVRYPAHAREALASAGIDYAGWLPNHQAPRVFARFALTVHVQRRPYVQALPGIPTIRPFEAMASGIPLISSPWDDVEGLFTAGTDYLVARDGAEMRRLMRDVLEDPDLARELAEHGRRTVVDRHTCAHRVEQLEAIVAELGATGSTTAARRQGMAAA